MSSYYCSKAVENCPNRQIIYDLIDDFCCVLDKTFGDQDRLKCTNGSLYSEIDQLRQALDCCEAGKVELERQLQEMQACIEKLQFCLDEECQTRQGLEGVICEMKAQLDRQDDIINRELAEKAELVAMLKRMETDNFNLKNQIGDFASVKDEYSKTCKGFESTRNKCGDLQKALAECCEKHDLMQKEILDLRNENNAMKMQLDNCVFEKNKAINDILQNEVYGARTEANDLRNKLDTCAFEKNQLTNEIEAMKLGFAAEKAALEAKICELLDGITKMEANREDICKQTNGMLAAHHEEMDNLKAEADTFRAKYEQEQKLREDLEQRLRASATAPTQSYSFSPGKTTQSSYMYPSI